MESARRGRGARLGAVALAVWIAVGPAVARAASDSDTQELRQRLEALEQETAVLKRKLEVKEEADTAKAKDAPVVGAGREGFFIKSADGKNVLKIRGYTQADFRAFGEGSNSNPSTFAFRRVRPILEGTVFEYVDFKIMPDFAARQRRHAVRRVRQHPVLREGAAAGRQVQAAGRPRAPPVGDEPDVHGARVPHAPRPEPRPRGADPRSVRRGSHRATSWASSTARSTAARATTETSPPRTPRRWRRASSRIPSRPRTWSSCGVSASGSPARTRIRTTPSTRFATARRASRPSSDTTPPRWQGCRPS